jgi:hypothetical protein
MPTTVPASSSSRAGFVIVLLVLTLATIAVGGYLMVGMFRRDEPVRERNRCGR